MAEDDGVGIRPCAEGDLPAVTAIYAHAVATGRASFELEPPDLPEMARRRAALVAGGYPYLVAERAGAVLGYAYAGPYRPRPAYRGTVETSVYLRPEEAGRGLGRRLLAGLIAAATEAGFRQMVAVIGDSGNAASIGLHAALGFRHVGVLTSVGWKHGTWLDTVLMQRALGPGDGAPPER
ncbi:GNAT family N-acetyltransferase [Methylobacterium platani]|uniref:GCN5 family acetyltransferase n=2 Tax=Methylobacterium platani TaxID=427683 RepID=A0A179S0J1_9HYPH|nr:GNAT family N-acetyltransferase [Methylobacterium platani]KMO17875.1 GCN5 family acetyltransferase [Methylobacterium platani JCM 14648]OAS15963.1 GCN5 family acetyltransferase [Methylobacterium platani]